jgi:hypothetical protein
MMLQTLVFRITIPCGPTNGHYIFRRNRLSEIRPQITQLPEAEMRHVIIEDILRHLRGSGWWTQRDNIRTTPHQEQLHCLTRVSTLIVVCSTRFKLKKC